jgi:hypothetical protein
MRAVFLAGIVVGLAAVPAVAPGMAFGPLAFYMVSQTCDFVAQSPPGLTVVELQQVQGWNWGNPIVAATATLVLNPGGYALCQPQPNGSWVTAGDGSGTIVWGP